MKQLLEKVQFEFHTLSIFSSSYKVSKISLVGKILWRFDIISQYMVNSFVVSLDIAIMVNILQEINNILHEKVLKAINLYWFHNNASEKNKSLNGHSSKPGSNE